jgi:nitrogen fixation protein NifU and related proteins
VDRQSQVEFILDHYEHPRNHGQLDDADVVSDGGNPGCGDVVTIYLKVDDQQRVEHVTFEGQGCTISQAAASLVTEMVTGLPLEDVLELSYDAIIDELGREVVMSRPRCATLALGTVKAAASSYQKGERTAKLEV